MAKKTRRPLIFSVTKVVKARARNQLGTPPPTALILDRKVKAAHGPRKHKQSMEELIQKAHRGEEM